MMLYGQGIDEMGRIERRDADATLRADLDLDDADRFQLAHGRTRGGAADPEKMREIALGSEKIPDMQLIVEQRQADLLDGAVGERADAAVMSPDELADHRSKEFDGFIHRLNALITIG